MEQNTLAGYERNSFKKGPAGRLRREGKIPAVIYGQNKPVHISVSATEFNSKFHIISENTLITINVDSEEYEVLVKESQENMIKGQITHLDFFEVERGKVLKTRIPVVLTGTAVGVKEGGMLEQHLHEIDIECLPKNIPASIDLDITNLQLGESIHISDLKVSDDVKILNSTDQSIVGVTTVKAEEEPETDEELEEGEEEDDTTDEETEE
jgi:large subunit ribosomal protein L25